MRESKECLECGGIYFRSESSSNRDWDERKYCSRECVAAVGRRVAQEKKVAADIVPKEPAPAMAKVEGYSVDELQAPDPERAQGIERELKIVRVGPNPRILVCEYMELAERRTCKVLVKRTTKFVRGMRLKMIEPASEADYVRPWVYTGPPPRHRGKW